MEKQLDEQLREVTQNLQEITNIDTEEYSQLKEIEEMCLRVKPAKTKKEIRREIEDEKKRAKFAKKVDKKLNKIMQKLERMNELEMKLEKQEAQTRKMEQDERKWNQQEKKKVTEKVKEIRKEIQGKQKENQEREKKEMEEITQNLFAQFVESLDQIIAEQTYKCRAQSALAIQQHFEEILDIAEEEERKELNGISKEEKALGQLLNNNLYSSNYFSQDLEQIFQNCKITIVINKKAIFDIRRLFSNPAFFRIQVRKFCKVPERKWTICHQNLNKINQKPLDVSKTTQGIYKDLTEFVNATSQKRSQHELRQFLKSKKCDYKTIENLLRNDNI